jgi:hypothetical protein
MPLRIQERDHHLLRTIAGHQVLTTLQIAKLCAGNLRAVQRRLQDLVGEGLLRTGQVGPALCRERGKPPMWFAVTNKALRILEQAGIALASEISRSGPDGSVEHQLLINDFRVALAQLPDAVPQLRVHFQIASDAFAASQGGDSAATFIPDGVVRITDVLRNKTVLFYLEADMDNEPLNSERRACSSIEKKIHIYQDHFRLGEYKRHEKAWACQIRGFRVLLVSHAQSSVARLCGRVRSMPPSNFIWITDRAQLCNQGLAQPIWIPGGVAVQPPTSIIGSLLSGTQQ